MPTPFFVGNPDEHANWTSDDYEQLVNQGILCAMYSVGIELRGQLKQKAAQMRLVEDACHSDQGIF